jgi:hypothetical protein
MQLRLSKDLELLMFLAMNDRTRESDCPNVQNENSKSVGVRASPRDCPLHGFQNMTQSMMFCLDLAQEICLFNCETTHGLPQCNIWVSDTTTDSHEINVN